MSFHWLALGSSFGVRLKGSQPDTVTIGQDLFVLDTDASSAGMHLQSSLSYFPYYDLQILPLDPKTRTLSKIRRKLWTRRLKNRKTLSTTREAEISTTPTKD